MRKTHVGRLKETKDTEVTVFRDDTLEAEDRAFFLKVRDVVENAVSEATFKYGRKLGVAVIATW